VPKEPTTNRLALEKVPDDSLREKLAAGGTEPISVILEVDLPPQQLRVPSRAERLRGAPAVLKGVVPETPGQQRKNADRIAKTGDYLQEILGTTPKWLAASRAFVFKGTPAQLRKIIEFSYTRAVRPNRKLTR